MRHGTDEVRQHAERHQTLDGIEAMLTNTLPPVLVFSEVSEDIYVLPAGYGHPTRRTIVAPRHMQAQLERQIGSEDEIASLSAYKPFRSELTPVEQNIKAFRDSVRRVEHRLIIVGTLLGGGIIAAAVVLPR